MALKVSSVLLIGRRIFLSVHESLANQDRQFERFVTLATREVVNEKETDKNELNLPSEAALLTENSDRKIFILCSDDDLRYSDSILTFNIELQYRDPINLIQDGVYSNCIAFTN